MTVFYLSSLATAPLSTFAPIIASLHLTVNYVCGCAPYFFGGSIGRRSSGGGKSWRGSQTAETTRHSRVSMMSRPSQMSAKSIDTVNDFRDGNEANEEKDDWKDVDDDESPRLSHVSVQHSRPFQPSRNLKDTVNEDEERVVVKDVDCL
ncbi:hypothetical protein HDU76_011271 [Blyttiomyces sp. JEL0837]|nr:hypothetical protein HDU76_011271 [Blyttiomyces sp. JEL0837]